MLKIQDISRITLYNYTKDGNHINRGLFISKTGKAINTDLNDAINIILLKIKSN